MSFAQNAIFPIFSATHIARKVKKKKKKEENRSQQVQQTYESKTADRSRS